MIIKQLRYSEAIMNSSLAYYLSSFDPAHQRSSLTLENPNQLTLEYDIQVSNQISLCQKEIRHHLSSGGEKIPAILHRLSELQVPARIIVNNHLYLFINAIRNNYYSNQVIRMQCNTIIENWLTVVASAVMHDYNSAISQMRTALQTQFNPRVTPVTYNLFRPIPPPPRSRASGFNYKNIHELPQAPEILPSTTKHHPPTINIDVEDHIDSPYEPKKPQTANEANESNEYDPMHPQIKRPRLSSQEIEPTVEDSKVQSTTDNVE